MQIDAELLNAVANLIANLTDKVIVIIAIIIAVFLLIKNWFDNKNKKYYFDAMLKEKKS